MEIPAGGDSGNGLAVHNAAARMSIAEPAASYRQRGFLARRRLLLTKIGVLLLLGAAWKWGDASLFRFLAWPGLLLTGCGIAMRIWAAGYLHKHDSLAVAGPYALIRHPLYVGTGLIVCGQSLLSCVPLLPIFALGLWFALYLPAMREEDEYLAASYGSAYYNYRASVPALLPRSYRWFVPADVPVAHSSYSWEQVWRNREYEGVMVHIGLTLAYLWLNGL